MLRSIGANVRRLRLRQRLTQEALAEAASVDVTFLQRIERAKVNISIDALVAISDALDVRLERLLRDAELPPVQRGRPKKR